MRLSKGISPLVASVLLIAITMSIAGILAFWASSYVSGTLPQTNKTQQQCSYADFTIYACSFNSTSGTISLNLQNIRTITFADLTVYITYTNNSLSGPIKLNGSLASGDIKGFALANTTTNITTTFSKVTVVSLNCPDISKESICTRS